MSRRLDRERGWNKERCSRNRLERKEVNRGQLKRNKGLWGQVSGYNTQSHRACVQGRTEPEAGAACVGKTPKDEQRSGGESATARLLA